MNNLPQDSNDRQPPLRQSDLQRQLNELHSTRSNRIHFTSGEHQQHHQNHDSLLDRNEIEGRQTIQQQAKAPLVSTTDQNGLHQQITYRHQFPPTGVAFPEHSSNTLDSSFMLHQQQQEQLKQQHHHFRLDPFSQASIGPDHPQLLIHHQQPLQGPFQNSGTLQPMLMTNGLDSSKHIGSQRFAICSPQGMILQQVQDLHPQPMIQGHTQIIILPQGGHSGGNTFLQQNPSQQPTMLLQTPNSYFGMTPQSNTLNDVFGVVALMPPQQVTDPNVFQVISRPTIGAASTFPPHHQTGSLTDYQNTTPLQSVAESVRLDAQTDQDFHAASNGPPHVDLPSRPLHAYNYFFIEERERLLQEDDKEGEIDSLSKVDRASETLEAKKQRILQRQLKRDRSKRRPHRKSHGKIGFKQLSQRISQTWRHMRPEDKQLYKDIASLDAIRYRRELDDRSLKRGGEKSSHYPNDST